MLFKKTLFTGFAPNLRGKDLALAMKYLFFPWRYPRWVQGNSISEVENWLLDFYQVRHAVTIDSGRSALLVGLKALELNQGDEVMVQSFTCVVVINAIKQSGATPVYVDIDETLNIDTNDLRKKINNHTKAVIVQHTFGNPADMDSIMELCYQNNLVLIEDCAHSLGVEYKGKKVGTMGNFAILSFGSDKCVSSVRGGAFISNDDNLATKVKEICNNLPNTRRANVLQALFHYIIFFKAKLTYSLFFGKIIFFVSKRLNLTGRIIYDCEKRGEVVSFYPAKFANALASLLMAQLDDFDKFAEHRKKIANIYQTKIKNTKITKPVLSEGSIPLRYNILTETPDVLTIIAKNQNVILGDWYRGVVAPLDIDMNKIDYEIGSCPKAEKLANRSVNLPTNINISENDADRIVEIINKY